MKFQLTSNYPFSDMNDMVLPSAVKAEMEKRGLDWNPFFARPLFDTGLQIKKREPMRERELSTEELLNLFERAESLKMAYIPHFITQCIIYYLDQLVSYVRINRLADYKKYIRKLKNVKDDYIAALRCEMSPRIFQKFIAQRDEYLASCGADLNLMYFTFGNQILKKYGRINHEPVFWYSNIILALVNYVEDFDRNVNRRISEKTGMPCRNHGDARLTAIKGICADITEPYYLEKNKETELCVSVMVNKAMTMINNML